MDVLAAEGQVLASDAEFEEICRRYGDLQTRLIPIRPRRVLVSKEMECPSELRKGFELLKDRIVQGEDLRPYLSRAVNRFEKPDDLLSDWGIYHLHLGNKVLPDGLMGRTGPLLFARFTADTAFLINIWNHGSWSRQDIVRILHYNWPETISAYRLVGVSGLELAISDGDIEKLRGEQINAPVEVEPGIVYVGLGGGITLSRVGAKIVRTCDATREHLQSCEEFVHQNLGAFVHEAQQHGHSISGDLHFRLIMGEGQWSAIEESTNMLLRLP